VFFHASLHYRLIPSYPDTRAPPVLQQQIPRACTGKGKFLLYREIRVSTRGNRGLFRSLKGGIRRYCAHPILWDRLRSTSPPGVKNQFRGVFQEREDHAPNAASTWKNIPPCERWPQDPGSDLPCHIRLNRRSRPCSRYWSRLNPCTGHNRHGNPCQGTVRISTRHIAGFFE